MRFKLYTLSYTSCAWRVSSVKFMPLHEVIMSFLHLLFLLATVRYRNCNSPTVYYQ